jgi:hypothetical protein
MTSSKSSAETGSLKAEPKSRSDAQANGRCKEEARGPGPAGDGRRLSSAVRVSRQITATVEKAPAGTPKDAAAGHSRRLGSKAEPKRNRDDGRDRSKARRPNPASGDGRTVELEGSAKGSILTTVAMDRMAEAESDTTDGSRRLCEPAGPGLAGGDGRTLTGRPLRSTQYRLDCKIFIAKRQRPPKDSGVFVFCTSIQSGNQNISSRLLYSYSNVNTPAQTPRLPRRAGDFRTTLSPSLPDSEQRSPCFWT